MIYWMRNHASPEHAIDSEVEAEDVFGLALILQKNLFESEMPDPGHSPSGLFDPIKSSELTEENLNLLKDQIDAIRMIRRPPFNDSASSFSEISLKRYIEYNGYVTREYTSVNM